MATKELIIPPEFAERARVLYPENSELHRALDAGAENAIEIHLSQGGWGIPLKVAEEIITFVELLGVVEVVKARRDLFEEWKVLVGA